MRRMIVAVVMLATLMLLIGAPAQAANRTIAGAITQRNTTGVAKRDFHMVVSSDAAISISVTALRVDAGAVVNAVVQGNNTTEVTLTWNVSIPAGADVAAGFQATQDEENAFTITGNFTPRSSPTDVSVLGWRVTCCGCVFLSNGYPSRIMFQDLRLLYPSEITLASMFALLEGSPTGTPALVPSGSVPSGTLGDPGKLFVGCYDLEPGDYLIARLDTSFVDPEFSGLEATVLIGHEHQLPYWQTESE